MNIDEEPTIASAFGVQSIPTLVVLHQRKVTAAAMGAMPKSELVDALGLASLPTPIEA